MPRPVISEEPVAGNGAIPIIGARKPQKKNDFATLAQVEAALTEALNKIDAIHQFYLQQLPPFVANMVVDGLVAHGLIPELRKDDPLRKEPVVPSDAQKSKIELSDAPPAPNANESTGSATPTAAPDAP